MIEFRWNILHLERYNVNAEMQNWNVDSDPSVVTCFAGWPWSSFLPLGSYCPLAFVTLEMLSQHYASVLQANTRGYLLPGVTCYTSMKRISAQYNDCTSALITYEIEVVTQRDQSSARSPTFLISLRDVSKTYPDSTSIVFDSRIVS